MKKDTVILLALLVGLCTGVVGCKKGPVGITPLPGRAGAGGGGPVGDGLGTGEAFTDPNELGRTGSDLETGGVIPLGKDDYSQHTEDRGMFADHVVYFDFDKSEVGPSEIGKLEAVAAQMGSMQGHALRIEGHCDERGTEEYNRSLGERRALAVREVLIRLGMNPNDVVTVSYGEDRPADPGSDAAAWAKNRRGEVILLVPPGSNP